MFFPVNDNLTDKEGGSHWSLLLYRPNGNAFYHFDPISGMNDRSAAKIIKRIIDSEKKIPEVKYVTCPRQRNGYDCGPYTLMFAENVAENVIAGVEVTKIVDCDARKYRLKLRNKINEKYNLNENDMKEYKINKIDEKLEELPNSIDSTKIKRKGKGEENAGIIQTECASLETDVEMNIEKLVRK